MPEDMKHLLQNFPSFLRTGDVMPNPTHGVEHHIHTGSHPPVFAKSHRLDLEKLENAKAEFKHLESACIVHRSQSPWASPFCTSWRPCGNYLHLNLVTNPDKYPLPKCKIRCMTAMNGLKWTKTPLSYWFALNSETMVGSKANYFHI
jgi:hypothetical protein